MKYTPGPWRVGAGHYQILEDRSGLERPGYERVLCQLPLWHSDNMPEADANAHLIAAAPDLYEAARAALDVIPTGAEKDALIEALLKAEGK